MIITYAVMYRPERAARARALAEAVGAQLVCDPRPDLPPSNPGGWGTFRLAWLLGLALGGTHHVVLEDDADPCPNFTQTVAAYLADRPRDAVILYANRRACAEAAERGEAWANLGYAWANSQGIALPVGMIPDMVRRGDGPDNGPDDGHDTRMRNALRAAGIPMWATVPSLVEHALPADSLIKAHSDPRRVARVSWRSYRPRLGPEAAPRNAWGLV